jgi:HEAT repeat protein
MNSTETEEEELTEEQKAHIAVLRSQFFRKVSYFSVFGTIILLIILRFTVYNYKTVADYEEYVDHKDKFIRFNTAKALGDFKDDPRAVRLLTQMLKDDAREVRWHAAASLSKIKNANSTPGLIKALELEKDTSAKSIDIYALGQIKDQKAVPVLEQLLNTAGSKEMSANEDRAIKLSTIQALAYFGSDATIKILKDFEKNASTSAELKEFSIKMRTNKGEVN